MNKNSPRSAVPVITLSKKNTAGLHRRHPWIFSGALHEVPKDLPDGSWVHLSDGRDVLASGHFHYGTIAMRIFAFEALDPDDRFWKHRLWQAWQYRNPWGLPSKQTNAFRWVFGEADGLPGLVLDYYHRHVVMQCHTLGIWRLREQLAKCILDIPEIPVDTIYVKSAQTLHHEEAADGWLHGNASGCIIAENNLPFEVCWAEGQKTGFFLDQRENRHIIQQLAKGKRVLNTFCYTGGFSIYALAGGAGHVDSVDSSSTAIRGLEKNLTLQESISGTHQSFIQDVMPFLRGCTDAYDVVILDPPAYAKHQSARHKALQAYQRLNAAGLSLLKTGGWLMTFSCSQAVPRAMFESAVCAAAIQSGRNIRIAAHLQQPPDHPVHIFHPEGDYLKGLLLYVENETQ